MCRISTGLQINRRRISETGKGDPLAWLRMADREAQRQLLLEYLEKDAAGLMEQQGPQVGPEMEKMMLTESVLQLPQPVRSQSIDSTFVRTHNEKEKGKKCEQTSDLTVFHCDVV